MILLAAAVPVKGKGAIGGTLEIEAAYTLPWVALAEDGRELPTVVAQDPHRSGSGAVDTEMIFVAGTAVVKGEDFVCGALEIEPPDAASIVALGVDCCKGAAGVLEDEDGSSPGTVEDEVVELPTGIVVEGDGAIGCALEIEASDAVPWISFVVLWAKDAVLVFQNPARACTWPI